MLADHSCVLLATANYMNIELKMKGVVSNLKCFHTSHFDGEKFVVFLGRCCKAKYILQRKCPTTRGADCLAASLVKH